MKETRIPVDTPSIIIELESGTLQVSDIPEFVEALQAIEPNEPVLVGVVPRGGGGPEWEALSRQAVTTITHVVNVWLPWVWEHGADAATKIAALAKAFDVFQGWAKKRLTKEKLPTKIVGTILGPRGQVIKSVEITAPGHVTDTTKERQQDFENGRPPFNIIEE